jgi:hypothetical protein
LARAPDPFRPPRAGYFQARYRIRRQRPEYLVLVRSSHRDDHSAAFGEHLITRFQEAGLTVRGYRFRDDPRQPPDLDLDRLMLELRIYLHDDGLRLLRALAVYPEPAWNLTLALDNQATRLFDPGGIPQGPDLAHRRAIQTRTAATAVRPVAAAHRDRCLGGPHLCQYSARRAFGSAGFSIAARHRASA